MKIEKVLKKNPINRFLYWIEERHKIYLKRQAGELNPWTDDEVLQSVFFTNPYRENDKTTVWFRENVREPLRNKPEVLFATVCFRWFNRISTGELLLKYNLLERWRPKVAIRRLVRAAKGGPVFTGAYMIKAGNGPPGCKIGNVCDALTNVWQTRKRLLDDIDGGSLEDAVIVLKEYPHLGGFMAYEIATDLRHTYLLENAPDIMTWANPGPGCLRGLKRMAGGSLTDKIDKPIEKMRVLLKVAQKKLRKMPPLEMREIEHSLCEFFKYEKALFNLGHNKRKYKDA